MLTGTLKTDREEAATPTDKSNVRSERLLTAWAALAVAALVVVVFWKVIFSGVRISDFYLIAHWDSLFAAYRRGVAVPIDPSGLLESIPYYTLCAKQFHAGVLPLWNHLNAFGIPLVGDLQATVFSPSRWLFDIFPCAYTYNLQLVTQVLVCALGTFALARTLGAGRLASLLAAVAFGLSPFMLWYLELQSGVAFVLYPGVLWLFARAGQRRTSASAVVAGISSGVSLLIGHPEPAFFGTAAASLLMALIVIPQAGVVAYLRLLSLAAISALCTAAPVVLPFVEFMKNGDCYKFGVSQSVTVPWQALAFNLMSPTAGGASPFLGIMAIPLAALAFTGKHWKTAVSVAVVCVACLIPATNLFPFSVISKVPPISFLITVYLVPLCLLFVAILSALGLTNLGVEHLRVGVGRMFNLLLGVSILVLAVPLVCHAMHMDMAITNFDVQLPDAKFSMHTWVRDAIIASVLLVVTFLSTFVPPRWVATVFVALSLISVGSVSKSSLPACPDFALPDLPVTNFLRISNERCLAMSAHIFKPNVNAIYGIEDVRSANVMWPRRYLKFVTACGATPDPYTQTYMGSLSRVLDLGSVKYVLSQTPVVCREDPQPPSKPMDGVLLPVQLAAGLIIDRASVWSDVANGSAGGSLHFVGPAVRHSPLRVVLVVKSQSGDVLWFSDRLTPDQANVFTVPMPSSDRLQLFVRAFDVTKSAFVPVNGGQDELMLSTLTDSAGEFHPHFVFRKEFDNKIRLFENTGSLPHAYVAFQSSPAASEDDAFKQITAPLFDGHKAVVLEQATGSTNSDGNGDLVQPARITKRQPSETAIEYRTDKPGWLVLTDTFYPGWNAYLDGRRVQIVRANYLFRAIAAPSGSHTVEFRYEPRSFYLGAIIAFVFFLCASLWMVALRLRPNSKNQ